MRLPSPYRCVFLLLLAPLLQCAYSLPDLAQRAVKDPDGDFYDDVSEKEWAEWERDGLLAVNGSMGYLLGSLESTWPVAIHVRLVGWSAVQAAHLRRARLPNIKKIGRPLPHTGAAQPQGADVELPPSSVRLTVSVAPASLLQSLNSARDALLADKSVRHAEISAEKIEALLDADRAAQQNSDRTWYLYVLNLTRVEDQSYLYNEHRHSDASMGVENTCGTPLQVHQSSRMAWLDQASGPADWGAVVAGLGHVSARHVPLTPDPTLPDVVAFIHRTVLQLLAPSQYTLPPYLVQPATLVVRVVVVRGATQPHTPELASALSQAVGAALQAVAFDANAVRVEMRTVPMSDWPAAAAALSVAVRTRTSTYHSDSQLRVTVHPYLDAHLLAASLNPALAAFDNPPRNGARLLRVVLFDLGGSEPLLLDRLHQAMSISPELVLAVQTNASRLSLDYRCGKRSLVLDTRNATRAVLGALLTSVYGVASMHHLMRLEAADEEALEWALARTLYGSFSSHTAVTRTTADLARRAYVMQVVHTTSMRIATLAAQIELDVAPTDVLNERMAQVFRRRIHLLRFLWLSAAQAQSDYLQAPALVLARAAAAEAQRIERLALSAASSRRAQLSCPRPAVLAIDRALLILSLFLLSGGSAFYFAARIVFNKRTLTPGAR